MRVDSVISVMSAPKTWLAEFRFWKFPNVPRPIFYSLSIFSFSTCLHAESYFIYIGLALNPSLPAACSLCNLRSLQKLTILFPPPRRISLVSSMMRVFFLGVFCCFDYSRDIDFGRCKRKHLQDADGVGIKQMASVQWMYYNLRTDYCKPKHRSHKFNNSSSTYCLRLQQDLWLPIFKVQPLTW